MSRAGVAVRMGLIDATRRPRAVKDNIDKTTRTLKKRDRMICLTVKALFVLILITNIYASIQLPVVLQNFCKWSSRKWSSRNFAVLPFLHLNRCEDMKKGLQTNQARLVTQDLNLKEAMIRQYEQELMTQGESVTIMCVGESGVGKTSLISNILTVPLERATAPPTKEISDTVIDVDDGGVRLSVTFVDTPGYGDVLEIGQTFRLIAADLDQRMKNAVLVEGKIDRPGFLRRAKNLGVDVVLYFIAPHRLKGIDIEFMRMIQGRASIIPILAKADTMTAHELAAFRVLVARRLAEYPWGVAESENAAHSDLRALRKCLLTEGLMTLHEATERFYECYRAKHLALRCWNHPSGFVRQFAKLSVQTLVYMLILRTQAIQRLFTHGLLSPLKFSRRILKFSRQIFEQWLIGSADEADDVEEATRINTQREREQAAMCPLFLRGAPQWVVKNFQRGKEFMDRVKVTYG